MGFAKDTPPPDASGWGDRPLILRLWGGGCSGPSAHGLVPVGGTRSASSYVRSTIGAGMERCRVRQKRAVIVVVAVVMTTSGGEGKPVEVGSDRQ
jgi:hypothetical protein